MSTKKPAGGIKPIVSTPKLVEQALRSIGDLKLTVDSTIDQVGQLLVEQAKKLTAVQEAVRSGAGVRSRAVCTFPEMAGAETRAREGNNS